MNQKIFKRIDRLNISSKKKLEIYKRIHLLNNIFRKKQSDNKNISLVPSNESYGHEYWLKKYAGWNKSICGLIEHGLYLGNNHEKVGDEIEYDLKCILTYGNYRKKILNEAFPEYNILKIGPRIAYAETDCIYKQEIQHSFSNESGVLTLFPAHSISSLKSKYDVKELIKVAHQLCEMYNLANIIVCLPYADTIHGNDKEFREAGCQIVSAGADSVKFLPRLRAIIECSDLTMSNSLGTNLGYCVYMGCQQVLISQKIDYEGSKDAISEEKKNKGLKYELNYQRETEMFSNIFNMNCGTKITQDQYKLCDEYWGFGDVKTKDELYNMFKQLQINYENM